MAARTKFTAAIAAVAALWAAMLLCGCGEGVYEGRTYVETLANGETREIHAAAVLGYYMETVDGEPYLFEDEPGNACDLNAERDDISFDSFTNGDRIVVWWSRCEQTYPGHLFIYDVELVEEGDVDSLPQSVRDEIDAITGQSRYFFPEDVPVVIEKPRTFTRTLPDGGSEEVTVEAVNGYLMIAESGVCLFFRHHGDLNDSVWSIGHVGGTGFAGLTSGDRVLIWPSSGIKESFPGSTTIFAIELVEEGSIDEMPKEIRAAIDGMSERGWKFTE